MQTLLLELGGPLVFAFVLLAIVKFIRGLIDNRKDHYGMESGTAEEVETEVQPEDPTENDHHAT
jgi:hypothetical protein